MAGVHAMLMASGGGGEGGDLYLKPNGVTVAAASEDAKGKWHDFMGKNFYVAIDYDDLVSVVSVYKGLSGAGEVLANLTRDGQTKTIPLNQVVTTFVDKFYTSWASTALFYNATTFNQLIASWDTSNVTNMGFAFYQNGVFNQPIGSWDTSNVTNMNNMFGYCTVFNQPIGSWDTSNVTDMRTMFYSCSSFVRDISSWCVSNIPSKPSLFDGNTPVTWTTVMKPNWGAAC